MALNLQAVFDAEVELPQGPECCICYETIGKTNNCTTPCGHSFCFKCMVKCLGQNSACPYCRTVLVEEEEDIEGSDDEGSDSDDESDTSDTSSNYITQNTEASAEKISEHLATLGYTMTDMISIYLGRVDTTLPRNTPAFVKKMHKEFDDVIERLDQEKTREFEEREMFMEEDVRRHNRTVKSTIDAMDQNEPAILATLFV